MIKKRINMTYKKQLIDLLTSDAKVKETMEKLEFGCKIIGEDEETIYILDSEHIYENNIIWSADGRIYDRLEYCKIIGLPLQERFIRMYCKNNIIHIFADVTLISFSKRGVFSENIKINNELDFNQQSEETYKQIFLALTNLTNDE